MSKKTKNPLFDINNVLNPKQLGKAANAATRLEYKPIIRAHTRELKMIARQRARDQRGLAKLGDRTTRQMNATYGKVNRSMNAATGAADQIGTNLKAEAAANIAAGQGRMDDLATGTAGNQLASLANAGVPSGQSSSQSALAKAIADRAAASTQSGLAFQGLANAQASGMSEMARNRAEAANMQQAQGINSVRSAVMSRRMDSRAAYGDAQTEVRDSLRTARGLRGATKLNNAASRMSVPQ
jgi:hypothetical protein